MLRVKVLAHLIAEREALVVVVRRQRRGGAEPSRLASEGAEAGADPDGEHRCARGHGAVLLAPVRHLAGQPGPLIRRRDLGARSLDHEDRPLWDHKKCQIKPEYVKPVNVDERDGALRP